MNSSSKKPMTQKQNSENKVLVKKPPIKKHNKPVKSFKKYETEIIKLKTKITQLQKNIVNLESQNIAAKLENQKNIHDFQTKAKEFQAKAVFQVNQIKEELNEKFAKDQDYIKKYSLQKFFESIIKPFVNLMQAIEFGANSQDNNVKAYVTGFLMYINQLLNEFYDFGMIEIKPQIGEEFNPEIHSALSIVEGHKKNHIVEVKQNGFKFYDRVIKPADVIVGK